MMLGIEAREEDSARGPLESEELGQKCRGRPAYRLGRVHLVEDAARPVVPACAQVVLENNGSAAWSATSLLVLVEGDDAGLPQLPLGTLEPGEAAEVILDLEVRASTNRFESKRRSTWLVVDGATGEAFGPALVLDCVTHEASDWQPVGATAADDLQAMEVAEPELSESARSPR
eukprot:TRINITY_DN29004_c0_g1_i1.p1 TRINITY_DN29004_c0_g1~~TRINITY_DN29004_c0_g1_i1.p1  ORF type:complete len:202 (-),score=39.12 TRINITY_DN29004_c0_g1_i1:228-749(-)